MAGKRRLLIVDGYNVLNAWKGALSAGTLEDARDLLTRRLHNYAGYTGQQVVLVFDAWLSDRKMRTAHKSGQLSVVFTQKGETADHFIERLCDECAHEVEAGRLEVRVATSDLVEQTVVFGRGAIRLSSRELIYELEHLPDGDASAEARRAAGKVTVMERLPADVRQKLERMRRGQ